MAQRNKKESEEKASLEWTEAKLRDYCERHGFNLDKEAAINAVLHYKTAKGREKELYIQEAISELLEQVELLKECNSPIRRYGGFDRYDAAQNILKAAGQIIIYIGGKGALAFQLKNWCEKQEWRY